MTADAEAAPYFTPGKRIGGCALSHSMPMLSAARTIQGFGAAGVMSVNGALVRFIYPSKKLGQGIGFKLALKELHGLSLSGARPNSAASLRRARNSEIRITRRRGASR